MRKSAELYARLNLAMDTLDVSMATPTFRSPALGERDQYVLVFSQLNEADCERYVAASQHTPYCEEDSLYATEPLETVRVGYSAAASQHTTRHRLAASILAVKMKNRTRGNGTRQVRARHARRADRHEREAGEKRRGRWGDHGAL